MNRIRTACKVLDNLPGASYIYRALRDKARHSAGFNNSISKKGRFQA
jgi:hypothetical protein